MHRIERRQDQDVRPDRHALRVRRDVTHDRGDLQHLHRVGQPVMRKPQRPSRCVASRRCRCMRTACRPSPSLGTRSRAVERVARSRSRDARRREHRRRRQSATRRPHFHGDRLVSPEQAPQNRLRSTWVSRPVTAGMNVCPSQSSSTSRGPGRCCSAAAGRGSTGLESCTAPGLGVRSQLLGTPRWNHPATLSTKQPLVAAAVSVKSCVVAVPPSARDARRRRRVEAGLARRERGIGAGRDRERVEAAAVGRSSSGCRGRRWRRRSASPPVSVTVPAACRRATVVQPGK